MSGEVVETRWFRNWKGWSRRWREPTDKIIAYQYCRPFKQDTKVELGKTTSRSGKGIRKTMSRTLTQSVAVYGSSAQVPTPTPVDT